MFANLLLLHNESIEDIILDMKDGMAACNPKIGKQRIQHHSVAKLGCIMCLIAKIEITRWTEFLQKEVEEILKVKAMLAISAAKINDGTAFKDDFSSKQPVHKSKKKKVECCGVHVETAKDKQVQVKREISEILAAKIPS